jgi:hypothetical protein
MELGLTEAELVSVEERFGFRFAPDHRALLSMALPVGAHFPDWRHGSHAQLRDLLSQPAQGVLFDIQQNRFWYPGWGERPDDDREALKLASHELCRVPPLIPVYSHRYLPGLGGPAGHPVLSVHQSDVMVFGADLPRYLRAEFSGGWRPELVTGAVVTVPFWSFLVEG